LSERATRGEQEERGEWPYLSPPVAMSAYYLKQVVPQWSLGTWLIARVLVMLFPEIALWFPRWLFDQP
jgi:TRAP-type mannitol/chloroaromatic compound transport system permease large subunit